MILCSLFALISLWYLYENSYKEIPRQSIYIFVFMLFYIVIYLNIAFLQEQNFSQRYTYIFTYFPLFTYYMILFPDSVLIPTKEFFPNLSEHLAIDATMIMAWVGFLFLFVVLLGLRFVY